MIRVELRPRAPNQNGADGGKKIELSRARFRGQLPETRRAERARGDERSARRQRSAERIEKRIDVEERQQRETPLRRLQMQARNERLAREHVVALTVNDTFRKAG